MCAEVAQVIKLVKRELRTKLQSNKTPNRKKTTNKKNKTKHRQTTPKTKHPVRTSIGHVSQIEKGETRGNEFCSLCTQYVIVTSLCHRHKKWQFSTRSSQKYLFLWSGDSYSRSAMLQKRPLQSSTVLQWWEFQGCLTSANESHKINIQMRLRGKPLCQLTRTHETAEPRHAMLL